MKRGFTLLEILLVIAAIGILAAIVIVAINPQRQLAQVRDAQRQNDVNVLQKALEQYLIDNGEYPAAITGVDQEICAPGGSVGCIDLSGDLVPTYLAAIPVDPNATGDGSGYRVGINATNSRLFIESLYYESEERYGINLPTFDAAAWTPAALGSALALWLDADDSDTITLNGTDVSQWDDKSGNGRDAVQGSAAAQPTYTASALNGRPGLVFDGSDDFMSGTNWWLTEIGSGAFSVFHVFESSDQNFGVSVNAADATGRVPRHYFTAAYMSYNTHFTLSLSGYDNSAVFQEWNHDGVQTLQMRRNGGAAVSATQAAIAPSLGFYAFPFKANEAAKPGKSSEHVVVKGSISATNRQKLEGYFAHKWGLTYALPPTHPYKWDTSLFGGSDLSGFDADAKTYITAVETADQLDLEPDVRTAINDFVVGLKADGIWNAIKASTIMAGARTLSGALVPLKGTAPTNFNFVAGDYNRETGLKGDGSTKYLDAKLLSSTLPANSNHLAAKVTQANTLGDRVFVSASPSQLEIGAFFAINSVFGSRNNSSTPDLSAPGNSGNLSAFYGISRNNVNNYTRRYNGVSATINISSSLSPTGSAAVFSRGTSAFTNARLSFYSIGESLDLALLDARVTDLMTAIGAAIP